MRLTTDINPTPGVTAYGRIPFNLRDTDVERDLIGVYEFRQKPMLEIHIATRGAGRAKWFGVALRLCRWADRRGSHEQFAAYIIKGSANQAPAQEWVLNEMGRRTRVNPSPWGMVFYADNRTQVKDWLLERGLTVEWQGWPVAVDLEKREERRREREMRTNVYEDDDELELEVTPSRTAQTRAELLRARADRLAAQEDARIQRLRAEADRLDRMPPEPTALDGKPMIYFEKQFREGGRVYDYGALKSGDGLWYTTGPNSPKGYTWEQLLQFLYPDGTDLDEVSVWQVTEMREI